MLRNNNISYIPREIGYLTRLRELHVQGNTIQWLPPEIGMFPCYIELEQAEKKLDDS